MTETEWVARRAAVIELARAEEAKRGGPADRHLPTVALGELAPGDLFAMPGFAPGLVVAQEPQLAARMKALYDPFPYVACVALGGDLSFTVGYWPATMRVVPLTEPGGAGSPAGG